MRDAVVHRGALVREQGGRWLPVMWFSSRGRAMEFGQRHLADGTWQVVMVG